MVHFIRTNENRQDECKGLRNGIAVLFCDHACGTLEISVERCGFTKTKHIGLFRAKGIGTFRSYVTDAKKVFLIYRTKGLPIAISVSEPDEFMPFYLKGGAK